MASDVIIKTSVKETQPINTSQDLTLTKAGSITITQKDEVTVPVCAIKSKYDGDESEETENTLTLNGKISVTDKKAVKSYRTCGVYLDDKDSVGYECTILTEYAKKITVTKSTTGTSTLQTSVAAGIYANNASIYFGGSSFLHDVKVTVTNNVDDSDNTKVLAFGICADTITFDANLAGAITVNATSKASAAGAYGIGDTVLQSKESSITFQGITDAITVTASGGNTASAYGAHATKSLIVRNDIDGKIKVTATSSSGFSRAGAFCSDGDLKIGGSVKQAITVKSTAKSEGACSAFGFCGGTGVAMDPGLNTTLSVTGSGASVLAAGIGLTAGTDASVVDIDGDIAGKISVTATGSGNTIVGTNAYGIFAKNGSIDISGLISKAMTVKSTLKITESNVLESKNTATRAYGVYAGKDVSIGVGIKADISATATGTAKNDTDVTVTAGGCFAEKGLTIGAENDPGTVAGNIKATATASAYYDSDAGVVKKGVATAYGLAGSTVTLYADITKNITVSATANSVTNKATKLSESGTADAYGIYGTDSVKLTGMNTKTATVKATSKASTASAYGIYGGAVTIGEIGAGLSVSAMGVGTVTASGIKAGTSLEIKGIADKKSRVYAIAGSITATATNNGATGATTATVIDYSGDNATGTVTITGNITKSITATAKSKATDTSLTSAYGINAEKAASVVFNGVASSTIKAEASSKAVANAIAINASELLKVDSKLGTLTATATGTSGSSAIGISVKTIQTTGADNLLTATVTATCKAGTACGLKIASLIDSEGKSGTATLSVTATGATAYGIQFTGSTEMTLASSKVTGKGSDKLSEAYSLYDGAGVAQKITLDKSTLTGDVDFGAGDDTLILTNKAKVTGEVDMGEGTADKIKISSGSQIKGDVVNLNSWNMVIEDAKSKDTAMWEGANFADDAVYSLDISSAALSSLTKIGKSTTFTLMKDTDNTTKEWEGTSVTLKLDDEETITLEYNGVTLSSGDYDFQLLGVDKGKTTTTMQLVVTKNA